MSVTTLAEAKLHLRVTDSVEDTLLQTWLNASERAASQWMGRYLYADSGALTTAKSSVQTDLTAATASYESAITAAEALTNEVEQEIAIRAAMDAYSAAQAKARMTHFGVVVDENIKSAVLVTLGALYVSRDEDASQAEVDLPKTARFLLQPYKVYG